MSWPRYADYTDYGDFSDYADYADYVEYAEYEYILIEAFNALVLSAFAMFAIDTCTLSSWSS